MLTDKSGCRRNDEILLFPSTLPAPISSSTSTFQSNSISFQSLASSTTPQPPPTPFPVNTRWKFALGISLPTAGLLLALVIYWRIRQRSKILKEEPRAIIPPLAAAPGYEKPEFQGIGICELPAASLPELDHEHIHEASTGPMASKLQPTHLLEMDTANLPELDSIGTCYRAIPNNGQECRRTGWISAEAAANITNSSGRLSTVLQASISL